jgi:ABC-type dipeptide/oligopeptide/nickel transport system ATPase component
MIQLEHVGKQYGGKRHVTALHDMSATVTRGEMVSIVGPSGSGKSMLLNLVGGLDRPTSGEVRVDGQTLGGLRDDELTRVRRDKIGFIFQFFNLLPSLTSIENVGLPLHLRGWARRKVEDRGITGRRSCRAASRSGSRLLGRCRCTRPSFSPTNRRAISTRAPRTGGPVHAADTRIHERTRDRGCTRAHYREPSSAVLRIRYYDVRSDSFPGRLTNPPRAGTRG